MRVLFRRFFYLIRRSCHDADLREEMETHRSLRQEAIAREGRSAAEAARRSRRTFGNVTLAREDARHVWIGPVVEGCWQDARYAVRSLIKRPTLAAAAILTLALALGANLAIFSLIDRVLLRPLDVPDAGGLMIVQHAARVRGVATPSSALDWSSASLILDMPAFRDVAAASADTGRPETLLRILPGDNSDPITAGGQFVTANYFRVLGLAPALGRDFGAADDDAPAVPAVMLGHRFWVERFGGDPRVIGRAIRVNDTPAVVVGVSPRTFMGTQLGAAPPDLYLPLRTAPRLATNTGSQNDGRGRFSFSMGAATAAAGFVPSAISPLVSVNVIGRIETGMEDQARAELSSVPGLNDPTVASLVEAMLPFDSKGDLRQFLGLLGAAVALTLLVGCANLAGLLLARTEERRAELAVRAALGAGRLRLVHAAFAQAAVLAVLGGAAALLVARAIDGVLSAFVLPGNIALSALRSSNDGRFLLVAMGLVILAALVVGVAPAARVSSAHMLSDLKHARLSPRLGVTPVLVAIQVAVCIVFVCTAMLFVRSLSNALATDVGFDRSNLIAASLRIPRERMFDAAATSALLERVRAMPGVATAIMGPLPLVQPNEIPWNGLTVDGRAVDVATPIDVVYASSDFFTSLGQPVLSGRDFDDGDRESGPLVAVVNETAARRFWSGRRAVGSRIARPLPAAMRASGAPQSEFSIVGVVGDVKLRSLRDADQPVIYLARVQHQYYLAGVASAGGSHLIVRASGDADRVASELGPAVAGLGLSLQSTRRLDRAIDDLLMPQRVGRTLLVLLGVLALALTAAGIYGLVSCLVAHRTKEIAVRLAVGAGSPDIVRALASRVLVPVLVGVVLGSASAWVGGRYVDRFMYGIAGSDPATLVLTVAVIVASAAAAASVPIRRALRIDPVDALRAD